MCQLFDAQFQEVLELHEEELQDKSISPSMYYADKEVTTVHEKVDLFNEFFASVFTDSSLVNAPPDVWYNLKNELAEVVVTRDQVLKLLKEIDPSKATGPDHIPARF